MNVLVDTSVWVAYFRGSGEVAVMDCLLEEGLLATNDLILAELLPALLVRKECELAGLLKLVERSPVAPDWDGIIQMQIACLKHGINRIGIPDLIIAQHAVQYGLALYSLDKHFLLMSRCFPLHLYGKK